MAKKKIITVKDWRSDQYDCHNNDHRNSKLFTIVNIKNTTLFRIGEMISEDQIMRLNVDNDWEIVIK